MKTKSVKSGILRVAIIGLSVMVLSLVFYYIMQVKQQHNIEQLVRNDRTTLVNKVLNIYSQQYSNIVRDNSAWDEFIASFINGADYEWLLNNIGYMLENYDATCVCVFDTLGQIAYQRKIDGYQDIDFFNFDGKSIPELMDGKHFFDFHLLIKDTLYEYHGAAIVSAADMLTRVEKAKGYLFMIKKISKEMLSQYRNAVGNSTVELVYTEEDVEKAKEKTFPNYLIIKEMKDYNNNTVAYIYFVFKNSLVRMFKNFIPIFILVSLMCILTILLILFYTEKKIAQPLKNIAQALDTEKTDKIISLKKEINEFGVISQMMEEFFIQKDNLRRLNTDLAQKQEEIIVQNETLLQQKEEIVVQNETLLQQKEEILVQHENMQILNEKLSAINEDLVLQRDKLENANKQLTAGITYASRLQSAMLQAVEPSKEHFKNFFIIYSPRDLVGGDFYFTKKNNDTIIAALGDCTGHGVPGAILASMGISFLTQLFNANQNEEIMPDEILMRLKRKVSSALGLDKEGEQRNDGMDVAILIYNTKTYNGYFAGAQRPMVLVRDGELFTIKGDNIPIGHFVKDCSFTPINIKFQKKDRIYLYSDGCTDQLGGPKKRKLMARYFKEEILKTSNLDINEQKTAIEKFIWDWKGDLHQTDDISLLAFEID
jgi:serine phosphatase RsbU (regulator of sigma subunit)